MPLALKAVDEKGADGRSHLKKHSCGKPVGKGKRYRDGKRMGGDEDPNETKGKADNTAGFDGKSHANLLYDVFGKLIFRTGFLSFHHPPFAVTFD